MCQLSQQRQQRNRDEAIEGDVCCPDERWGQVSKQPTEAKPVNQPEDVFCPMIWWRTDWMETRFCHFYLDVREQIKVFIIFVDPAFPFA